MCPMSFVGALSTTLNLYFIGRSLKWRAPMVRRSYEGWCECVMAGLHLVSILLDGDSIRFGGRPLAHIMSCLSNCTSCVFFLFYVEVCLSALQSVVRHTFNDKLKPAVVHVKKKSMAHNYLNWCCRSSFSSMLHRCS
jgi:hypothetical protein